MNMKNTYNNIVPFKYLLLTGMLVMTTACSDFLDTKLPSKQLPSAAVFQSDGSATSATVGMYEQIMENFSSLFNGQMTLSLGLTADELLNTPGNAFQEECYTNSLNPNGEPLKQSFWNAAYKYIYQANAVISGVVSSSSITKPVAQQLEGEARFMRAFVYLHLVNLFGDVPYTETTDYRENMSLGRLGESEVYKRVVNDLLKAQQLLGDSYVTSGKVRPNKAVATALLARVYLYQKDWTNAETETSKVIGNANYGLLTDLNTVFLAGSKEAIWQMIPSINGQNTAEGNRFALTNTVPSYAEVSSLLLTSFETGDKRRTSWINQFTVSGKTYATPYKYKVRTATVITEYYTVLRLAEQYLIRAEARANLGNMPSAIADLDVVRSRAGLPLLQTTNPSISQANLLLAIEHERQIELLCEWGHRWFDLKRTSRLDVVMTARKPTAWKSRTLFPIPQSEILLNSNLVQNPGY